MLDDRIDKEIKNPMNIVSNVSEEQVLNAAVEEVVEIAEEIERIDVGTEIIEGVEVEKQNP